MNQRIRELAELAGLSEGVFTRHDGVPCDLKGYSMLPDELEKFAQLIVRECIEEVMNYRVHNNPTREIVPFIVQDIKLHFGVEL